MASVPTLSDYENFFLIPGAQRPVRKDIVHPFARASLKPAKSSGFSGKGGFALVYRVVDAKGKEWAIRCPLRINEHAEREHASALTRWSIPQDLQEHLVIPQLFESALFVQDEWRDVTVMEWVQGRTLQTILEADEPTDFQSIASKWESLVGKMRQAGVAHGDLQPDNLMIDPMGRLVLVDYDSFLVPGREGLPCPVGGRHGYGHPTFTSKERRTFDIRMDTFSALLLLLSLKALALNPLLLRKGAEDGFVIPADELTSPGKTFSILEAMPDPVSGLATSLRRLCEDVYGGLEDWALTVRKRYVPRYELKLPSIPVAPCPVQYSPFPL